VRHQLVQRIVEAYEKFDKTQKELHAAEAQENNATQEESN
jgi:phosphate starvation-inducible protein PhoH